MKAIIYSICIGALALAGTAWGEEIKSNAKARVPSRGAPAVRNVTARSYGHATSNVGRVNTRSFSATRVHQPTYTANHNVIVRQPTANPSSNARVMASRQNFRSNNEVRAHNYVATNRNRNLNVGAGNNVQINHERNFGVNRQGNVAINNNWRSQQFNGRNYAAFRNYSRTYHDRFWWQSHYPRISFYFGAPYYWDAGYWYPAWGYYPDYVYQYDGPIYGYNGLAPDQVVLDVQVRLQRDGYYSGPVDGVLGPMTRQAITAFQADHGLAVTSTIDEPTLSSLGLG